MRDKVREIRAVWLVLGLVAGLGVSYLWPREAAYAMSNDRDAKFAMCTCPVGGLIGVSNPIDGVFVLDFLTGSLKGAVLNLQVGKFSSFYVRDLAKDFKIDPQEEPHYAFVAGNAQISGRGGVNFATGVIYVGELTSGKVMCYGFPWRDTPEPTPVTQLGLVDAFQFRQPSER